MVSLLGFSVKVMLVSRIFCLFLGRAYVRLKLFFPWLLRISWWNSRPRVNFETYLRTFTFSKGYKVFRLSFVSFDVIFISLFVFNILFFFLDWSLFCDVTFFLLMIIICTSSLVPHILSHQIFVSLLVCQRILLC